VGRIAHQAKTRPFLHCVRVAASRGRRLRRAPFSLAGILCYHAAMSRPFEYLFAVSLSVADQAVRKKGRRQSGRAAWQKPDGAIVYFICFEEQLAIVPAGATVHVVGKRPAAIRRLKRICAVAAIAA
jgi:hypothetical protein